MDREPNAREQFEKYRDDDIKGLTNYAREYGAVKALELAAQKTATLQLVIDRYRTGELRAELRPEPTAGNRKEAKKAAEKVWRDIKALGHYDGDGQIWPVSAIKVIAAALSAARGNAEQKERAKWKAAAEQALFVMFGFIHADELDYYVGWITTEDHERIKKAFGALAAILEVKENADG